MKEKKNSKIIAYIIIIILMIVCFIGGYFIGKTIKESNKEDEIKYLLDKEILNEIENMRDDLKDLLKNGYNAYAINCQYVRENDIETKNEFTMLSNDSVEQIVNKLKLATRVEKDIPVGYLGCPPQNITYIINNTKTNDGNKKLIVMYGYDSTLFVGYNQIGYVYHYNNASEINNFLENLIK